MRLFTSAFVAELDSELFAGIPLSTARGKPITQTVQTSSPYLKNGLKTMDE